MANSRIARDVEAEPTRWVGAERFSILMVLMIPVVGSAIWIESLNAQAGFYLPRRDFGPGNPKWRWARLDEARWRQWYGPHDSEGRPLSRPLTEAERMQMSADLRVHDAKGRLQDAVIFGGCLQYLLVPLALVLGLSIVFDRRIRRVMRIAAAVTLIATVAAGSSMLYRDYFGSLGW